MNTCVASMNNLTKVMLFSHFTVLGFMIVKILKSSFNSVYNLYLGNLDQST